eukprot:Nk52_evm73s208 gene=Nk52_evmTU73s208
MRTRYRSFVWSRRPLLLSGIILLAVVVLPPPVTGTAPSRLLTDADLVAKLDNAKARTEKCGTSGANCVDAEEFYGDPLHRYVVSVRLPANHCFSYHTFSMWTSLEFLQKTTIKAYGLAADIEVDFERQVIQQQEVKGVKYDLWKVLDTLLGTLNTEEGNYGATGGANYERFTYTHSDNKINGCVALWNVPEGQALQDKTLCFTFRRVHFTAWDGVVEPGTRLIVELPVDAKNTQPINSPALKSIPASMWLTSERILISDLPAWVKFFSYLRTLVFHYGPWVDRCSASQWGLIPVQSVADPEPAQTYYEEYRDSYKNLFVLFETKYYNRKQVLEYALSSDQLDSLRIALRKGVQKLGDTVSIWKSLRASECLVLRTLWNEWKKCQPCDGEDSYPVGTETDAAVKRWTDDVCDHAQREVDPEKLYEPWIPAKYLWRVIREDGYKIGASGIPPMQEEL